VKPLGPLSRAEYNVIERLESSQVKMPIESRGPLRGLSQATSKGMCEGPAYHAYHLHSALQTEPIPRLCVAKNGMSATPSGPNPYAVFEAQL
jgi:hypothetical protein